MIRNFSDHAANERTFLAWVRTAIGLIAFGFVVERFNLVLRVALANSARRIAHSAVAEIVGLGLMAAGVLVIGVAFLRFMLTAREIEAAREYPGLGARFDLALTVILLVVGCALVAYMVLNFLDFS
jgi:putative membrane protein